nr:cytochrome b/b6 domain-containing protein [Dyella sedimenti]
MTAMHEDNPDMAWQNQAGSNGTLPSQEAPVPAPTRPRMLVALHWLTALLLLLGVALILLRDQLDGRAVRLWLLEGHRHVGLLVLLLFFARALLRLRLGKLPSTEEGHVAWPLRAAAAVNHAALYLLILAQPLLGWALSNAEDKPVHFLGLTLPALVAPDEDLADNLSDWHQDAAWLLLGLVALHVGAALWHHFILKDRVLRAMLPRRRR